MITTYSFSKKSEKEHLTIPLDLCVYALSNHKSKEVALYVYLKYRHDGGFLFNKATISQIQDDLKIISTQTVKKYFFYLFNSGWIYKKDGKYILRGYRYLAEKLKFKTNKCGVFYPENFPKFKSYLAGLVISYLMKYIKYSGKRSGQILEDSSSMEHYKYDKVPYLYLAKFLDIPQSTAFDLAQLAKKDRFIKITTVTADYNIDVKELPLMRKYGNKDQSKRLIKKRNRVAEQLPNHISSYITIKKSRQFSPSYGQNKFPER